MTDTYVKIQIVGAPDECLDQTALLRQYAGLDHLVREFGFGGMPRHRAEPGMRLFADKVMPVLRRDALFAKPPEIVARPPVSRDEGVFVPA